MRPTRRQVWEEDRRGGTARTHLGTLAPYTPHAALCLREHRAIEDWTSEASEPG